MHEATQTYWESFCSPNSQIKGQRHNGAN